VACDRRGVIVTFCDDQGSSPEDKCRRNNLLRRTREGVANPCTEKPWKPQEFAVPRQTLRRWSAGLAPICAALYARKSGAAP